MLTDEDEAQARQLHSDYMQALSTGDMKGVAALFTFPAVFKGFLDDIIVANDASEVMDAYEQLIAVAPKAERTELLGIEVNCVRPKVFLLSMTYEQFGVGDEKIHSGQALYLMKPVGRTLRLYGVI